MLFREPVRHHETTNKMFNPLVNRESHAVELRSKKKQKICKERRSRLNPEIKKSVKKKDSEAKEVKKDQKDNQDPTKL